MVAGNDLEIARQKANAFLDLLRKENVCFEHAYLFGSYAKGQARPDSDIDVALVADTWGPSLFDTRTRLMELACTVDCRIEPHPIEKEFFTLDEPFSREVMLSGKQL